MGAIYRSGSAETRSGMRARKNVNRKIDAFDQGRMMISTRRRERGERDEMENIGFQANNKFFFFGGDFSAEKVERIKNEGVRFLCIDEEEMVVATGRFHGDIDGEIAFRPLDWAEGEFGATEIRYERNGKFVTL